MCSAKSPCGAPRAPRAGRRAPLFRVRTWAAPRRPVEVEGMSSRAPVFVSSRVLCPDVPTQTTAYLGLRPQMISFVRSASGSARIQLTKQFGRLKKRFVTW